MPLSDNQQALVMFVATFLVIIGTATIAFPSDVPLEIREIVGVGLSVAGAAGYALKEALGGTPPTTQPPASTATYVIKVTNPTTSATWEETNATQSRIDSLKAQGMTVQMLASGP